MRSIRLVIQVGNSSSGRRNYFGRSLGGLQLGTFLGLGPQNLVSHRPGHLYDYSAWSLCRLVSRFGFTQLVACGFLFILMTWFGVNYILATGLHSYRFSSRWNHLFGHHLSGSTECFIHLYASTFLSHQVYFLRFGEEPR